MESFLDIYQSSLNRAGEELCGDQVRVVKSPRGTTIVLSDGLGSGVKANILATLTSTIIATLLREEVALHEVIDTVIGTLPIDRERGIAYSAFSILTIDADNGSFLTINFDSPAPFFVENNRIKKLPRREENILGKKIEVSQGTLGMGDFIGLASDGVLYAAPGTKMSLDWDWDHIAARLEKIFTRRVFNAHSVVNSIMAETNQRYEFHPGDDATLVGVLRRKRNTLMVFTGPPLDNGYDYVPVFRLLDFEGRRVVCGGTTANIVASYLKAEVETDMRSMTEDIPAIGRLPGIDLVTEGILTLAGTAEALEKSQGEIENLAEGYNGVYLLSRELLGADAVYFMVGQSVNPAYQNPLLPKNVSIRRYLVEKIAGLLESYHKDIEIDYY